MPEGPEVEWVRATLAPAVAGATVSDLWSTPGGRWDAAYELAGATLGVPGRAGKWVLLPAGDSELAVHLGMTGVLSLLADAPPQVPSLRATWSLEMPDGSTKVLALSDVRGFSRLVWVQDPTERTGPASLADLGPDPLAADFDAQLVVESLVGRRSAVKALLLTPSVVAGVGNIYADEALFAARVHPCARNLDGVTAHRLVAALTDALAAGLSHGGTTLRDYRRADGSQGEHQRHLRCYGRAGEPCVRCATVLSSVRVAQRTSTFCPTCTPAPAARRFDDDA